MPEDWIKIRVRMGAGDVHYGGNLVAGASMLKLFGDLATEITIRHDGDEGLLAGYDKVEFLAPVYAGDYIEARARLTRVGNTSRQCEFEARKVARACEDISDSAAEVLDEPIVVCRATGTTVVKKDRQRRVPPRSDGDDLRANAPSPG